MRSGLRKNPVTLYKIALIKNSRKGLELLKGLRVE
jgi:hypothetical protein